MSKANNRILINKQRNLWLNIFTRERYVIHSSDAYFSRELNNRLIKLTNDFNADKAEINTVDSHISFTYKFRFRHLLFEITVYHCSKSDSFIGWNYIFHPNYKK